MIRQRDLARFITEKPNQTRALFAVCEAQAAEFARWAMIEVR